MVKNIFDNLIPNGLIERPHLLKTIIKVMEEGRAGEYKEARTIAEGIIFNEDKMRQQRQYLYEKEKKDDEQRRSVINSQLRMEKYAEQQANAARQSVEAASRVASEQEKVAKYAKDAAESSQKLLDLEEKRYYEAKRKE